MHPTNEQFSLGERGCAYSHYQVWNHAQNNGYSTIMVFEDDVVFFNEWTHILNVGLRMLRNTHCLMLNHSQKPEITHTWVPIRNTGFTGGYVLFKSGLEAMLSMFNIKKLYPADAMTVILQQQNRTYAYFPFLCVQENNDSDIQTPEKLAGVASGTLSGIQGYQHLYQFS